MLKLLGLGLILFIAALLGIAAWVRLSPNDPARWHIDVAAAQAPTPGPCADTITVARNSARATCLVPGTPAEVLAKLDAIALSTPRTIRLAGSPEDGRITWQTRSQLWGFPDMTTAQAVQNAQGTRLDLLARSRFGESDLGVNAVRLRAWLAKH